jgi:hypothetical protein
MHRLLRRAHLWPHQDGGSPGIIEVGPCRGVATPVVVIGTAGAVVLNFLLLLAFTLTFATVVGGGGRKGRVTGGHSSSCCGGCGGSSSCGGRPPPEGT